MSAIDKLGSIKNKILDKLITKESVSEIKERSILKGSYFKQLFKYIFSKKFKIKGDMNSVDLFFTDIDSDKCNIPKIISVLILIVAGLAALISLVFSNPSIFIITMISIIIDIFGTYIISSFAWYEKNKSINKKFNPENITEIKETIFENYSKEEVKQLVNGNLAKEELINIFREIEKLVGEQYFLDVFKSLNLHKQEKDISDPYVLLSVINEIIENKEKIDCANNKIAKSQKIIRSLLKESKEKERTCEYLKVN